MYVPLFAELGSVIRTCVDELKKLALPEPLHFNEEALVRLFDQFALERLRADHTVVDPRCLAMDLMAYTKEFVSDSWLVNHAYFDYVLDQPLVSAMRSLRMTRTGYDIVHSKFLVQLLRTLADPSNRSPENSNVRASAQA